MEYKFRQNLNILIHNIGKPKVQIANEIGITYPTFLTYCNGSVMFPHISKIYSLCEYFNVSIKELTNITDQEYRQLIKNRIPFIEYLNTKSKSYLKSTEVFARNNKLFTKKA